MDKEKFILQLQTTPASELTDNMIPGEALKYSSMNRYRKELIKVGKYIKASTGQAFEVTLDTLNHWVKTFSQWTNNGNRVPIPLGHDRAMQPEANQGWVTGMAVEGNSLYGIMELLNPELALTTDVSICIDKEVIDGRGIKYNRPITHVALCVDPVVPGLSDFQTLSLSLGENNMEFLKKLAKALKLPEETVTEADVFAGVTKLVEPPQKKDVVVADVALSAAAPATQVVKLVAENREIKLSGLVKAGIITPAIKDVIAAKYVENQAVTLELSKGDDNGFDFLYDVLSKNNPVKLAEVTGVQSLELSNPSVKQPNAMEKVVNARRKAAGLDK